MNMYCLQYDGVFEIERHPSIVSKVKPALFIRARTDVGEVDYTLRFQHHLFPTEPGTLQENETALPSPFTHSAENDSVWGCVCVWESPFQSHKQTRESGMFPTIETHIVEISIVGICCTLSPPAESIGVFFIEFWDTPRSVSWHFDSIGIFRRWMVPKVVSTW